MSTDMIWQTVSTSSDETERLAELLAQNLKEPELIELVADLGGGKTTFVKGLARGIGSSDIVASPTFVINKIYQGRNGRKLYHFDFYRLSDPGIVEAQLNEVMGQAKSIVAVEWSERLKNKLPTSHWVIKLRPVEQFADSRQITIKYPASAQTVIEIVENAWRNNKT